MALEVRWAYHIRNMDRYGPPVGHGLGQGENDEADWALGEQIDTAGANPGHSWRGRRITIYPDTQQHDSRASNTAVQSSSP